MPYFETLSLISVLGQDMRFWGTVLIAALLKWLFTPERGSFKETSSGIIAGAVAAYYGVDYIIRAFPSLTENDRDIVVIALVFTGEHLVRTLMKFGPMVVNKRLGISGEEDKSEKK